MEVRDRRPLAACFPALINAQWSVRYGLLRQEVFYRVFPPTVHSGPNQSPTLRWIYNHVKDGRDVVTPRDVIDLLTRATQRQRDELEANPSRSS